MNRHHEGQKCVHVEIAEWLYQVGSVCEYTARLTVLGDAHIFSMSFVAHIWLTSPPPHLTFTESLFVAPWKGGRCRKS